MEINRILDRLSRSFSSELDQFRPCRWISSALTRISSAPNARSVLTLGWISSALTRISSALTRSESSRLLHPRNLRRSIEHAWGRASVRDPRSALLLAAFAFKFPFQIYFCTWRFLGPGVYPRGLVWCSWCAQAQTIFRSTPLSPA